MPESLAGAIGFSALCLSVGAYYVAAEWRKARQAKIETDLKREMVQKGLSVEEIERVVKVSTLPRE